MDDRLKGKQFSAEDVENLYQQNVDYYSKLVENKDDEFDLLRLYFGEDYYVNDRIIIKQPTIQNIIDLGEKVFFSTIAPFISNTTSFRVQLWDLGIDWNEISDFELFSLLIKTVSVNETKIMFGDLDFSTFDLVGKPNDDGTIIPILFSKEMRMEIDEETYLKIRKYMCKMFDIELKDRFIKNKSLRREVIAKARADMLKDKVEKSSFVQMISFALNHPGFKYKKNELREVGYVEFIDSIKRLQVYEATRSLNMGKYSGFCDLSKVPEEEFNFMRKI